MEGVLLVIILMLVGLLIGPLIGVLILHSRVKKLESRISLLENGGIGSKDKVGAEVKGTEKAAETLAMARRSSFEGEVPIEKPSKVSVHEKEAKIPKEPREIPPWAKRFFTVESLISKLGILLLLIGVGYIYKLAYDSGYVTEELAVFTGILIGGILMFFGVKSENKDRRILSQVLFGGGIATFYISIYAAYQGYGLIHGILAFLLMCAVTTGGFALALMTNSIAMAEIAVLGALLTPFVLRLKQLGLFGTGTYIFVIAVLSMGIYVFKRWRILQISSIIGVYWVTTYFMSIESMSANEKVQLSVLMVLLMLVFTGVEHGLALVGKASSRYPMITYVIMAGLPLVTAGQVWETLQMSDRSWAIFFSATAVVYLLIATVYNRMNKDFVLENITIALTGTFFLIAIAVEFGGDVRPMAIGALALIYYGLAIRLDNTVVRWVGHALAAIAFLLAAAVLLEMDRPALMPTGAFMLRLVTALLFLAAAWMNQGKERLTIGIIGLECYLLPLLLVNNEGLLMHEAPHIELAVQMLFVVLFLWVLFLMNRRITTVPLWSGPVLAALPLLRLLGDAPERVVEEDFYILLTLAYMLVALLVYLFSEVLAKKMPDAYRLIIKITAYLMAYLLLLADVAFMAQGFAYGLIFAGALLFVQQFRERDREALWMNLFLEGAKVVWFLFVIGYVFMSMERSTFDWPLAVADAGLLIILYLQMKYYSRDIKIHFKATVLGVLFMFLALTNMDDLQSGNGIITLLWAAYAIGLLTFSVIRANKKLVNLSLGFIIVVAAKFVVVDLASVTTIWKIIVSMAFGTALLVLSYMLQPVLKRGAE